MEIKKKKTRAQTHTYSHVHINANTRIRTCKHTQTHKRTYRHEQFSGSQDLTFDLKMLRFSESLMLLGKSSHMFGPRKDIVSEP